MTLSPVREVPPPPRPTPAHLIPKRHAYEEKVRKMQDANRFQRSRAVADQLLLPVRGVGMFVGLPIPHVPFLGLFFPVGLSNAHVNTHEGRDPTRLRKHLFEEETSRRTSKKIVNSLSHMGVLTPDNRYARPITDAELAQLRKQYHLTPPATVKIGWALETFAQISREAAGQAPTEWDDAMPRG